MGPEASKPLVGHARVERRFHHCWENTELAPGKVGEVGPINVTFLLLIVFRTIENPTGGLLWFCRN